MNPFNIFPQHREVHIEYKYELMERFTLEELRQKLHTMASSYRAHYDRYENTVGRELNHIEKAGSIPELLAGITGYDVDYDHDVD